MSATMNYYELLGIDKAARPDAIKAAYKRMAMVWHPDRNKSANASEMFMKVREAYGTLMNKESRELYDAEILRSESFSHKNKEVPEMVEALIKMRKAGASKADMIKFCSGYGLSASEVIYCVNLVCEKVSPHAEAPEAAPKKKSNSGWAFGIAKFFAYALGGILAIFATLFGWVAYKVLKPVVGLVIKVVSWPIGIVMSACSIALVLDFILLALDLAGKYATPEYFVLVRTVLYFAVILTAELFGVDLREATESFFGL